MAQTNVMVSYAPAHFCAPDVPMRSSLPVARGQRSWGTALASVLLAGGAVFALSQFVKSDGGARDEGFPAAPRAPLAKREPVPAAPVAQDARQTLPPAAAKATRPPYLALVRHAPAPQAALAVRALAAPLAPRPRPQRVALDPLAVSSDPVARPAPAIEAVPSAPLPTGGLRRDLAGFLETQGHELAIVDPSGTLLASEGELRPELAQPLELTDAEVLPDIGPGLHEPVEVAEALSPSASINASDATPSASPTAKRSDRLADGVAGQTESATSVTPAVSMTATAGLADSGFSAQPAPLYVQSYPVAIINGEPLGAITLRDYGADGAAIHLRALIGLLRLRMPEAEFLRLEGSAAADRFVSIEELRASGIEARFDARNGRLTIVAR